MVIDMRASRNSDESHTVSWCRHKREPIHATVHGVRVV
jgi:hypothetical protein